MAVHHLLGVREIIGWTLEGFNSHNAHDQLNGLNGNIGHANEHNVRSEHNLQKMAREVNLQRLDIAHEIFEKTSFDSEILKMIEAVRAPSETWP